ncbi:Rho GTPase activation protein, partial [Neocallimastix californiae]
LQAMVRGKKARKEYLDRKNYYENNIDKVIKVQAQVRRFLAMKYYRELKSGKPSSNALHHYLRLMGDNTLDFDYDSEMEYLRELAIRKIRENLELEREVNTLDVKIELLVKNQISIQEVVHSSKKKKKNAQATEPTESIFSNKTPDKEKRRKYKLYQNLFYLVQTNQKYLAKLMIRLNSIGSNQIKTIENTVMSLYGYAQNNREEYLLLNLIKYYTTVGYGAKEQQYLRDLLQPLIKSVINSEGLELESNPVAIYKNFIRNEEYKTGVKPDKKYDVDPKEALADEETKKTYINHLQKLREITNKFLDAIIASLPNMPYSIRCIAMELSSHFMEKWPNNQADVTKILGNLIYYRYINPVICAPEGFDIIESTINQIQRKNLAEIAKLLHNISVNKPFAMDNQWLQPLNEYIGVAGKKFAAFFNKVACVETAEAHYQIDEFDDLAKTNNPIIFISPKEIIEVHSCILEHIEDIEINENDPLRIILKDLGEPVKTETSEKEIQLTLVNGFADVNDDGNTEMKHLLRKTKNMVLDILLIQNGTSIVDVLNKPSSDDLETDFHELVEQKISQNELESRNNLAKTKSISFTQLKESTFAEYKNLAKENLEKLEGYHDIKKENDYQTLLNIITKELLNKNIHREQKIAEIKKLKQTIGNLKQKEDYLMEQKNSYNGYIDQCMRQLSNNKKPTKPTIFSRQYYYLKKLEKEGKVPQFGSYQYTAEQLHKRHILESINGVSQKLYGAIKFTISSDEVGIFNIVAKAKLFEPTEITITLEELLDARYNEIQTLTICDGLAKINVNLLLHLINKK